MQKRKGFGRKREMLRSDGTTSCRDLSRHGLPQRKRKKRQAAIIGGGIASAVITGVALRRGWQVTLYCTQMISPRGTSVIDGARFIAP